jgi:DNA-3-methyladenine glycosylase II
VQFTIRPIPPYDFDRSLSIFTRWGEASLLDVYEAGLYRRVVPSPSGNVLVAFRTVGTVDEPEVAVSTLSPSGEAGEAELRRVAEHVLNARLDLAPCVAIMRADPVLAVHLRTFYGVRPALLPSLFEALVVAILEQQIALPVAITLKARLVTRYGEAFEHDARTYYAFPSPAGLSAAAPDDLHALGMSRRKAEYITDLAALVDGGQLDLNAIAALDDDALVTRLTAVRGIGRWSAEYAAIRGLGRMTFLLADDLGVRNIVSELYCGGRKATADEVRSLLSGWGDQAGLLAFYLLNLKRLGEGRRPG